MKGAASELTPMSERAVRTLCIVHLNDRADADVARALEEQYVTRGRHALLRAQDRLNLHNKHEERVCARARVRTRLRRARIRARVRACLRACLRACVRGCMRACLRVCVRARGGMRVVVNLGFCVGMWAYVCGRVRMRVGRARARARVCASA
eukprot:6191307-Pleurochrysis_carterae.AAC.4